MNKNYFGIFIMLAVLTGALVDASCSRLKSIHTQPARVQLVSLENGTDKLEFELFCGNAPSQALILPGTTLELSSSQLKPIDLVKQPMIIKCSKGSFLPVFIQDGGPTSGKAMQGYEGPFLISMWMQYPQVASAKKTHVRYQVEKGKKGKIGIKIGQKGDYRIVAHDDVKLLP